jgi:hypothetical protein
MPISLVKPEETYTHFHTRVPVTQVAKTLGVTKLTLRRWWSAKFGSEAYARRVESSRLSIEEKKERRRVRAKENRDKLNEQRRAWNTANPEKQKASRQAHRDRHREEYRAYCNRYYAEHAEVFREKARQYRKVNSQQVRTKEKDYYTSHPEILLFKGAKQRARKDKLPFTITAKDILDLIPSDGLCPITKLPFKRGEGKVGQQSMTLDRIEPSRGYVPGNIAVISHLANTIKQDCTDPELFRRMASYLEAAKCP